MASRIAASNFRPIRAVSIGAGETIPEDTVAEKASYLSIFTTKFVEIVGAGIATAVTGYLIAHLGGFFAAPATPAAVQAPSAAVVAKEPAHPTASAARAETRKRDAEEAKSADRKPHEASAGESKPHEATAAESKAREAAAAEGKAHDAESLRAVEARVRAALAKVDAKIDAKAETKAETKAEAKVDAKQPPAAEKEAPAREAAIPQEPTTVGTLPKRPETTLLAPPAAATVPPPAVAAIPPAVAPAPAQTMPSQPPQPTPLVTVDIPSLPVANVAATPPPAQPPAPDEHGGGLLATIKSIPDLLRTDSHTPAEEPPRPPMPVGD